MKLNQLSRRDFEALHRPFGLAKSSYLTRTLIAHVGLLDDEMIGLLVEKICSSEKWSNYCREMCNFADDAAGVARVLMQVYRQKIPQHPITNFSGGDGERYFFLSSLVNHENVLQTSQSIDCVDGQFDLVVVACHEPMEAFCEFRANISTRPHCTRVEFVSGDEEKIAEFGDIFASSLFFIRDVKGY